MMMAKNLLFCALSLQLAITKKLRPLQKETFSCCRSLLIESDAGAAKYQDNRLGVYHVIGDYGNRPVYKKEGGYGEFLFYLKDKKRGGVWMVGPQVGKFDGGLATRVNSKCPEKAEKQWKYTDGSSWYVDQSLSMTCSEVPQPFAENEINGKFKIMNMRWHHELNDPKSDDYKRLAKTIESDVRRMLEEADMKDLTEFDVTVQKFKKGSVVCDFKVNYILKEAYVAIPFAIKASNFSSVLSNNFKLKKGILFQRFLIAADSFNVSSSVDHCVRKGCSHKCAYDYEIEDYVCTCPPGLLLLNSDTQCSDETTKTTTEVAVTTTKSPEARVTSPVTSTVTIDIDIRTKEADGDDTTTAKSTTEEAKEGINTIATISDETTPETTRKYDEITTYIDIDISTEEADGDDTTTAKSITYETKEGINTSVSISDETTPETTRKYDEITTYDQEKSTAFSDEETTIQSDNLDSSTTVSSVTVKEKKEEEINQQKEDAEATDEETTPTSSESSTIDIDDNTTEGVEDETDATGDFDSTTSILITEKYVQDGEFPTTTDESISEETSSSLVVRFGEGLTTKEETSTLSSTINDIDSIVTVTRKDDIESTTSSIPQDNTESEQEAITTTSAEGSTTLTESKETTTNSQTTESSTTLEAESATSNESNANASETTTQKEELKESTPSTETTNTELTTSDDNEYDTTVQSTDLTTNEYEETNNTVADDVQTTTVVSDDITTTYPDVKKNEIEDLELDCKELEGSQNSDLPLRCSLKVKVDDGRTAFVLFQDDGNDRDFSRFFDKNVKVVVKEWMVMDISPK